MNRYWGKFLPAFVSKKLEGRRNLQNIIGNTGWLFADRIIRLGVGLFVGVWVARYLGPVQFGIFNYAQAFVSLFAVFATLGLDGIVVRDIVRDPVCLDETLGSAFLLKLIGGFLTLLMTVGSICLLRPDDRLTWLLVAVIAAGIVFQAFDVIDFWFQSQVMSKFTVIARNAAFLLVSLLKIVLILKHAPLVAFALAGLIEIMLGAAGLVTAYRLHGFRLLLWKGSRSRVKELIMESWPLVLSGLAIMVYMKIDQVMLGEMVGDEAVGLYSAAIRVSEIWYFIPSVIVSSVFPAIVASKTVDNTVYYNRISKLFKLLVGIAYLISIPMSLSATYIISVLYGPGYLAAGPILSIHIWASVFVFIGVGQGPWNINEGLVKLSLQRTLIGAIMNVALNMILIPAYSGIGAAIATVVSYAASAFFMNAFDKRTKTIYNIQIKALLFRGD
jgi:polysaccharide transporter, PST family